MANEEMRDIQTLIDRLNEISRSKDHRIDTYVEALQEFLKEESEWSERHDAVFNLMLKEVKSDRFVRLCAVLGVVVLSFVLVCGGIYSWYRSRAQVDRQELVNALTAAQLPLKFEPESNGQLFVVFDDNTASEQQDALLGTLTDIRLGHYPGLGERVPLGLSPEPSDTWTVTPQNRPDQIIGRIRIIQSSGLIDRLDQVNLDASMPHTDLNELYVKIVRVPEQWTEAENAGPVQYQARYGVMTMGNIVWDDTAVTFRSSADGNVPRGPFYLSHPRWRDIYVVTIAAGHWGRRVPDQPASAVIYRFSSIARVLRLNP